MATIYKVCTRKHSIEKEDDTYYVMESEGFHPGIEAPAKYNVLYESSEFSDAKIWLKDYLSNIL